MKKLFLLILVLLLALAVINCTGEQTPAPVDPPQEQQTPGEQQPDIEPEEQEETEIQAGVPGFKPSIAGIKLGDSQELALQILGDQYTETIYEEPFPFGEPFLRMEYVNGISLIVGTDSKLVFEIETKSADTTTNLGIKVGDKAQDALTKFRAFYEEPQSNHSDDTLVGWFMLEDMDLIIFNFAKEDILVNDPDIKPGALVERIKLSNFFYMD